MNQYRITKYNPKFRNENGQYTKDEWTDFSCIGYEFDNKKLTYEEYQKTENAYINTAVLILKKSGIDIINVKNMILNNKKRFIFKKKTDVIKDLPNKMKSVFRGEYGCRFENKFAFIHIGFDFYMYIGCNLKYDEVSKIATENGLFAEQFKSPYI